MRREVFTAHQLPSRKTLVSSELVHSASPSRSLFALGWRSASKVYDSHRISQTGFLKHTSSKQPSAHNLLCCNIANNFALSVAVMSINTLLWISSLLATVTYGHPWSGPQATIEPAATANWSPRPTGPAIGEANIDMLFARQNSAANTICGWYVVFNQIIHLWLSSLRRSCFIRSPSALHSMKIVWTWFVSDHRRLWKRWSNFIWMDFLYVVRLASKQTCVTKQT